jgi:hypothetical protein
VAEQAAVAEQHQYEIRHAEVRAALAATPTGVPFPSTAFQDALAFEARTAKPLDELVSAARRLAKQILDGPPDRERELHAAGFLLGKLIVLDEASG